MKELEILDKISEKNAIELTQEENKKVEYAYLNSIIPHSGHTLFEINPKDNSIKEAEFRVNTTYVLGDSLQSKKEVIRNKGMVYISALNKSSAMNRYNKGKGSAMLANFKKQIL
jgi:hypothetical protein